LFDSMQAKRFSVIFFFGIVANLILGAEAYACAVCLAGAAGGDRIADAFNWSVLFLMGAPYVVFGGVAGWLLFIRRRALREEGWIRRKSPPPRLAWVNKGNGK